MFRHIAHRIDAADSSRLKSPGALIKIGLLGWLCLAWLGSPAQASEDVWQKPDDIHVPEVIASIRTQYDQGLFDHIFLIAGTGNSGIQLHQTRHNFGWQVLNHLTDIGHGVAATSDQKWLFENLVSDPKIYTDHSLAINDRVLEITEKAYEEDSRLIYDDGSVVEERAIYRTEPQTFRSSRGELFVRRDGRNIFLYLKPFHDINETGVFVASVVNYFNQGRERFFADGLLVLLDDADFKFGEYKLSQKSSKGHGAVKSLLEHLPVEFHKFPRLRLGIGRPEAGVEFIDHVLGEWTSAEMVQLHELVKSSSKLVNQYCIGLVTRLAATKKR